MLVTLNDNLEREGRMHMAGFDPSKYVDKDWQQVHRIDRPGLTCEVVQLANAILVKTHCWMGEEAFEVSVIGHTLLCDVCKYRLWVWLNSEPNFDELMGLLGRLRSTLGEGMMNFLKNKYMMGSEQALSISCAEVQTALRECFRARALPEYNEFVVMFISHICICQKCLGYFGKLMESFEAQKAQEEDPP